MVSIESIRQVPRFSALSPAAHQWLAERMVRTQYSKGETIFQEGEPANHLHLIEKGTVRVFKTMENGRELILNLFNEGQAVGEIALVDAQDFPASAVAQTEVAILKLGVAEYSRMFALYPEMSLPTIRHLTTRVRALSSRLQELGGGDASARLAQVLLALSKNGQNTPEGLTVPLFLTRQELAGMIGARLETVIRIMSRWNKDGWVETSPSGFLLKRVDQLEVVASNQ